MKYEAVITAFDFREMNDLVQIELQPTPDGCSMTFKHTFNDESWAAATAAGWHQCLDALGMIVNEQPPEWPDNGSELREYYWKAFFQKERKK